VFGTKIAHGRVGGAFTGDDLRRLREGHGLSVRQASMALGVDRKTWARYEFTEKEPVPFMVRLALAAWVRGVPALGEVGATLPTDLIIRRRGPRPKATVLDRIFRKKRK
jgi:transcriptional regulator with XRE-family HTH domain